MLFDSNVFNMIDWAVDGVEPCTGMYIRTLPLASLPSCQLQGPVLDLALRFNQFNANDYGFGVGWELTLTRVEVEDNVSTLVLANGQRYRIQSTSDGPVTLQYKKTQTFNCTMTGPGAYTITYKSGFIEELINNKLRTITAPNGKKIYFNWRDNKAFSIQDENQNRAGKGAMVATKWSGQNHIVVTPRGSITYATATDPDSKIRSLTSVTTTIGTDVLTLYAVQYLVHNTRYLCIKDIVSLAESRQHEIIAYQAISTPAGMPGSVYAVGTLDFDTSGSYLTETFVRTLYARSTENYTGYPLVTAWKSDVDNLEDLPDSFTFSVEATTAAKRKIQHSYNKFYLLTSEQPMAPEDTPTSPKPGKLVTYEYLLVANSGINFQSPTFMLPVTINNIRQDFNTKTGKLQQISSNTQYTYDNDSNITMLVNPDGTVERYTYYPATGSSQGSTIFCPPDPGGFINYLREKTLSPYNSNIDHLHINTYTYIAIANTNLVQLCEAVLSSRSQGKGVMPVNWTKEEYEYQTNPAEAFYGSRIKTTFSMLYENSTPCVTTTTVNFSLAQNSVSILTTRIGFDDKPEAPTRNFHTEVRTADCGDVTQSTDNNNLTRFFTYDALGRLTKTTLPWGPGVDDWATITTSYFPATGIKHTQDSRERFQRTFTLNSRGDPLTESYSLTLTGQGGIPVTHDYLMTENTYNSLFQLEKSIIYDYTLEKRIKLTATTRYKWSLFDEILFQENPDISNDTYTYHYLDNTISVTHQPGNSTVISTYNNKGAIVRRTSTSTWKDKSSDGDTEQFLYDGYWNLINHSHSSGETLTYAYDFLGRVLAQKGEISGNKTYGYALHTTAALVTEIKVDGTSMGQRTYDGLDRETSSIVGKATTRISYDGSSIQTQPSMVSINNGRVFKYTYNAALNQLTSRTVTPCPTQQNPAPEPTGNRTYKFLQGSGLPASASNVIDSYTRLFGYDEFNNLSSETGNYFSPNITRRQPYYINIFSTIRGLPIRADVRLIDPDDERKNITVTKNYLYQPEGGRLIQEECLINSQLHSRINYSRDAAGNLVDLDTYAHIGDGKKTIMPVPDTSAQYFAKIHTKFSYAWFNLLQSKTHFCSKHPSPILEQRFSYNGMNLLAQARTTTGGTHALRWSEFYSYTKAGTLTRWQKTGNISFQDPFLHWIRSQFFSYSTSGNIMEINAEHSTGRLRINYEYTDAFVLSKITRQSLEKNGQPYGNPTTVSYTTDSEGNVISEITKEPTTTYTTTYNYGGETNFSSIKKSSSTTANLINSRYYYDASDTILSIEKDPGEKDTTVHCRYYLFNEIIAECTYIDESRATLKTYTIFHHGNSETLLISSISPDQNVVTYPCLNQPNGSQIAVGEYFSLVPPQKGGPLSSTYLPQYRIHLQGQNAYGYVFRTKHSDHLIYPVYKHDYRTGKMVETLEYPQPSV